MENNQTNNNINFEPKYNPFKDGSFWVALIIGLLLSGQSIFILFTTGQIHPGLIVSLVFLFAWVGWIIFKKGKKRSLVVGLIIAIILAGISFVPAMKIGEKQRAKQLEESMEKYKQQMEVDLEKMMKDYQSQPSNTTTNKTINCPEPYHKLTDDGRCLWSCYPGSTPGANNECVCKPGYVETGKDKSGRRICELKK